MKYLNLLALSCIPAIAFADTTLTFDNLNQGTSYMMIAGNKMKVNQSGKQDTSMLYNADTQTFTVIMNQDRKYLQFGPKEIEALGDIKSIAMKQVEKALSEMPEAQRAMMKDMMLNAVMKNLPKPKPAPTYSKAGKTSEVNGFSCEIVIKSSEGEKTEFCVTPYTKLGMSSADYNVIESFQQIAHKLASQFGQDTSMDFSSLGDYVPVQFKHEVDSGTLKSVNHDDIPSSSFEIPKDYREEKIPLDFM